MSGPLACADELASSPAGAGDAAHFALHAPAPAPDQPSAPDGPWFSDRTRAWGLVHRSVAGPTPQQGQGKRYLRDTVGQGVAVFDLDGDGRMELLFPQGQAQGEDGRDLLYLNTGEGLTERGLELGFDSYGYSFGALAFDYDSDGDEDVFITRLGADQLFANDGGRLRDVTAEHPGLAGPAQEWSSGAAAGDVDGDGDLDLYVARYCAQDYAALDAQGLIPLMGCLVPAGPGGLPPQADRFFRNTGAPNWRLEPHTEAAGFAAPEASYGFQPTFTDVDDDGDLDLYVTNDSVFNFLFMNDGDGRFVESALRAGVACGKRGQMEAGMGLTVSDLDGDGLPELHVTNFSNQSNSLYHNETRTPDEPWFEELSDAMGTGRPSWFHLAWGTNFADFDADGSVDLFVANGHVFHQVEGCAPERIAYRQPNQVFRGQGARFEDWSARAGAVITGRASHRGSASVDLDQDGDLDLVINRLDEPPVLALNESPAPGHWIMLDVRRRLVPGGALVLATGAKLHLSAGELRASRELYRGSSFLSCEDPRLHFGLGEHTRVDQLRLALPGLAPATLSDLPVDQLLRVIIEADGSARWEPGS